MSPLGPCPLCVPRRAISENLLMRRFTGHPVAILLVMTGVFAGLTDGPTDLSKWVAMQPPKVGDERWLAANNDIHHQWVVFLLDGRPSVRLRAVKREKGSADPEKQESYPPMPFKVPRGSAREGLAGEWFSVKVPDGWIIGFNAGEFGAGLWWFSPDGNSREKISTDQVIGFFVTDAGLLALEGIAHGNTSVGRIIRLAKGRDGHWRSEQFVDLKGAPETAVKGADGTLIVATHDRLLRVHLETRKIDVILGNAFWGGLYPNSMILAPSGAIYIGMRHGVVKAERIDAAYRGQVAHSGLRIRSTAQRRDRIDPTEGNALNPGRGIQTRTNSSLGAIRFGGLPRRGCIAGCHARRAYSRESRRAEFTPIPCATSMADRSAVSCES